MKDGPSLRDFIEPSIIDIPTEESIPYVQDIRGGNQKGFRDICCILDYIFIQLLHCTLQLLLLFHSSVL